MAFKLGDRRSKYRTPLFSVNHTNGMDRDIAGEANLDGSINIDSNIPKDSAEYKRVMRHELQHKRDMDSGRASYGENHVVWEGNIYFRQNGMIDGPAGRLPEGHPNHPWEQAAINAELIHVHDGEISKAESGSESQNESPYKFNIGKFALGGLGGMFARKKTKRLSDEEKKSLLSELKSGMMGGMLGVGINKLKK